MPGLAIIPLGTYIGAGIADNKLKISYTLRLLEKKMGIWPAWLDYKEVRAHDESSWHSEGTFKIIVTGDQACIKFEIGGMPGQARCGESYEFQTTGKNAGDGMPPILGREGIMLQPQADCLAKVDAQICVACQTAIEGQMMNYGGEKYHQDCFVCSKCGTGLGSKFSKLADGTKICQACVPKKECATCGEEIKGAATGVGGKVYHPACFICFDCKGTLSGGFFTKNDHNLCKPCLDKSPTKSKIRSACRGCKKPIEDGAATVTGETGDPFHPECFVCTDCSCALSAEDKNFKKTDNKYRCIPCDEKAAAEKLKAAPADAAPCSICSSACDASGDFVRMADGTTIHWKCFTCSGCAKAESGNSEIAKSMKVLRDKVKLLKAGTYKCSACGTPDKPIEVLLKGVLPLGTFTGIDATEGKDAKQRTYSVRMMENNQMWLDSTTQTKIDSSSWHSEGKFEEITEGGKCISVKFTVEARHTGGGPAKGTVIELTVEHGGPTEILVVEGVRCALAGAVPQMEIDEYMKKGEKVERAAKVEAAEGGKAVGRAVLPGEGMETKLTQGGYKITERTEIHDHLLRKDVGAGGGGPTMQNKGGAGVMERT